MKVLTRISLTRRLTKRLAGSWAFVAVRERRTALAAIVVTVALWATAVFAIAEAWRSEVPAVQAVGARATAQRVLDIQ